MGGQWRGIVTQKIERGKFLRRKEDKKLSGGLYEQVGGGQNTGSHVLWGAIEAEMWQNFALRVILCIGWQRIFRITISYQSNSHDRAGESCRESILIDFVMLYFQGWND